MLRVKNCYKNTCMKETKKQQQNFGQDMVHNDSRCVFLLLEEVVAKKQNKTVTYLLLLTKRNEVFVNS